MNRAKGNKDAATEIHGHRKNYQSWILTDSQSLARKRNCHVRVPTGYLAKAISGITILNWSETSLEGSHLLGNIRESTQKNHSSLFDKRKFGLWFITSDSL